MRFRKIVVERVTVVKFRVDNRGSDGTGLFRIEVRTDTAELSDMRVAGLRKCHKLPKTKPEDLASRQRKDQGLPTVIAATIVCGLRFSFQR